MVVLGFSWMLCCRHCNVVLVSALVLLSASAGSSSSSVVTSTGSQGGLDRSNNCVAPSRPSLVLQALAENRSLYYFGVGSNMLPSKIRNRSMDGPIEWISLQPAVVPEHRLALNMRGFPPLEPAMGALEPTSLEEQQHSSKPLHSYERDECHGALLHLDAIQYARLMKSEGVGLSHNETVMGASRRSPDTGYEEIVVTAIPYDASQPPVSAIALRARRKSRVQSGFDPAPSLRYMTILREGAQELGLKPCYQTFLQTHPTQDPPPLLLRKLSIYNMIFTSTLTAWWRGRPWVRQAQSWALWRIYVSPLAPRFLQNLSMVGTAMIIAPGAIMGYLWTKIRTLCGLSPFTSPFMARMLAVLDEPQPAKMADKEEATAAGA
jgi:hypothetical protein